MFKLICDIFIMCFVVSFLSFHSDFRVHLVFNYYFCRFDTVEYYTTYPKTTTFVRNVIIEGALHENDGKTTSERARKRCFVTC
jgi:hypothetical protein